MSKRIEGMRWSNRGSASRRDAAESSFCAPRYLLSGVLSIVACFLVLLTTSVGPVFAAEQRCGQLGANCVCSEPFNTTALPKVSGSWYNPGDSTTKQCTTSAVQGGAIERNSSDLFGDNNAAAMAALPSGRSITHFVRGPEGHLGIFFAGHTHNSDTFVKRLAVRFYIYHSPNFQFAQEGVCTNAKLMQFTGPNSLVDHSFGSIHMYNFTDFSPAQDCCFEGPGPDQGQVNKSYWRGKWVRIEAIYTNRAGPNWRFQLYSKDVTNNGPEYLVVDTSVSGTQLNAANRMPPKRQDAMLMNLYRETGCTGWEGFSHYMMAGWDSDSGQRIGAAVEVEGGGSSQPPPPQTSPPAPPTGVTIR
jgi:hypothetical protein